MRYTISRSLICVLTALAAPAHLAGQSAPAFSSDGIVSSTDSSPNILGLARGSLFTIYGSNLASAIAGASSLPYPTTLAGATVHFRSSSGGTVIDAPLLYASPSQINGIVPPAMTDSTPYVSVETAAGESKALVYLADSRFTAFATGLVPFGPAIVQQYRPSGITLNRLLDPAVPGDALVIWGTGLGSTARQDVTVYIGTTLVAPFYAGPAPGQPGLSQINFHLPADTPSRCFMPLTVVTGAQVSAMYTISTASRSGSDCESEIPLSREARQTLDQGGTIRLAALSYLHQDGAYFPGAEAWAGEYNSAYLSHVATYDAPEAWLGDYSGAYLTPGAAGAEPIVCSRKTYGCQYPCPSVPIGALPAQYYGNGSTGGIAPIVTGGNGCSWSFAPSSNGVYRAGKVCLADRFTLLDPYSFASFSGTLPAIPSALPEVHLTRSGATAKVWWTNPSGARLVLDLSSTDTQQGTGATTGRQLLCRLPGASGSADISTDFVWALGLPYQAMRARFWLQAPTLYGPWTTPTSAAMVRAARVVSGPIAIYDN